LFTQASLNLFAGDYYLSNNNTEAAIRYTKAALAISESDKQNLGKAMIHAQLLLLKCNENKMDNLCEEDDQAEEMRRLWLEIKQLKAELEEAGLPVVWAPGVLVDDFLQYLALPHTGEELAYIRALSAKGSGDATSTSLHIATLGLCSSPLDPSGVKLPDHASRTGIRSSGLALANQADTINAVSLNRENKSSTAIGHITVVGVDDYRGNLSPLVYTIADAEGIFSAFGRLGFTGDRLLGRAADRAAILTNLAVTSRDAPEDQPLIFYFAGHGFVDQSGRAALATGGTTPTEVEVVYLDEIATLLSKRTAPVTVIIDACMSSVDVVNPVPAIIPDVHRTVTVTVTPDNTTIGDAADDFADGNVTGTGHFATGGSNDGITLLMATRPGGVALEVGELGGGLFTHYLVRGLLDTTVPTVGTNSDGATLNGNGKTDMTALLWTLFEEASKKTSAAANHNGHIQYPIYFKCQLMTVKDNTIFGGAR
jgi:hypothetical protein